MTTVTFKENLIEDISKVALLTDTGIIEGLKSFNHTGNQTNLVCILFTYNGRDYKYPFSRKTGKLYACRLPFNIKMIV